MTVPANRHEIEALRKLERQGRRKAGELYVLVLRRRMDPATGATSPVSVGAVVEALQGDTGGRSVSALFRDLERAHLVQMLPAPEHRWRCHLKQVDREVPA